MKKYNWSDYYREMVSRNIGVIKEEEQEKLRNTSVAIAGIGGMGGFSALLLTQFGVGKLKIADPESFEISNSNRQITATNSNIGEKKVNVLSKFLHDINPEIEIEIFPEGITKKNVNQFVSKVDRVIDGIDYERFWVSVILHRAARGNGLFIYLSVAIGFGFNLFIFDPAGITIEEYVSLSPNVTEEEIKNFTVPINAFCPVVPAYAHLEIVKKATLGQIPIPNVGVAQAIGAGVMVSELVLNILGRTTPITVPNFISLDIAERRVIINKLNNQV